MRRNFQFAFAGVGGALAQEGETAPFFQELVVNRGGPWGGPFFLRRASRFKGSKRKSFCPFRAGPGRGATGIGKGKHRGAQGAINVNGHSKGLSAFGRFQAKDRAEGVKKNIFSHQKGGISRGLEKLDTFAGWDGQGNCLRREGAGATRCIREFALWGAWRRVILGGFT